jgi:hypothetical protein
MVEGDEADGNRGPEDERRYHDEHGDGIGGHEGRIRPDGERDEPENYGNHPTDIGAVPVGR